MRCVEEEDALMDAVDVEGCGLPDGSTVARGGETDDARGSTVHLPASRARRTNAKARSW